MKNFSIDKKKIKFYLILTAVLYIVLALAYFLRGVNDIPQGFTVPAVIAPALIFVLGITDIKIESKLIKTLLFAAVFLYMPVHIINLVMFNFGIKLVRDQFFNYLAVMAILLAITAVFADLRVTAAIGGAMGVVEFCANTWVMTFRGMAITPADMAAASTAFSVSGGYNYFISSAMIASVIFAVLLCVIVSKFNLDTKKTKLAFKLSSRVVCLAVSLSLFTVTFKNVDRLASMTNDYQPFDPNLSNKDFGVLLTFMENINRNSLEEPAGYSDEKALQILEETPAVQQSERSVKNPNIIVIMNESFADLEDIYKMQLNEDPLKNWHSLKDNTVSGNMLVSVYGGGTSYTEFEFLSGMAGGMLPAFTTPYLDLIHGDTHSLATDLKAEGYKNIAIHPFWPSCWNRGTVYPLLGFDEFISGPDFSKDGQTGEAYNSFSDEFIMEHTYFGEGLDYVRNYISDKESYNKIIEQFENKDKDEPLFIFNVTIQNHGGYDYEGKNYTEDVKDTSRSYSKLNQYESIMKQSDLAYADLIEYFKNYDEPTVILMFGDHQPQLYLDGEASEEYVNAKYKDYICSDSLYSYIVPYKLWTNYDIEEKQTDITSPCYLSLLVKDAAGIKYNKWDDFRARFGSVFSEVTLYGMYNGAERYEGGDSGKDELINDYKILEYYLAIRNGLTEK